jgi:iron complex transport system substrate-binding protein
LSFALPRRLAPLSSLPQLSPIAPLSMLLAASLVLGGCSAAATGTQPASGSAASSATATSGTGSPAAATPTTAPRATFPMTLTDDEGGSVTLASAPGTIVSLTPATTEIAFALGAGEKVAAVTESDDYPAQVKSLPKVATYASIDVEKIVALHPGLVLAGGNGFNDPKAIAQLRSLGIRVLVVYAKDVKGVLADIRLVGTALGLSTEATAMADSMRDSIDAIAKAATPTGLKPRVFYELDATKEIYGPASGSFVAEMITLAGGDPVTTGSPTVFSISLEKLVTADPQVIVLGDASYGTTADQVSARAGWSGISAVRNGAIRPVDDVVVTRPGPRLVKGLRDLALAINPSVQLPPEL